MNKLSILILLLLFACETSTNTQLTKVSFPEKEHNFGMLEHKIPVSYRFMVKNEGTTPLIINNIETSCGCTVPDWTKKPIKPGKDGEINITYNSDFPGSFRKTIAVFYNGSDSPDTLIIRGEVNYPSDKETIKE